MQLYAAFDRPETVGPWLASLDWSGAWRTSHLFWGGVHCFSFSARAGADWLTAAFAWLEANLDPATGWWRAGTPHADRHQGLGGAAHLLPLFAHHGRRFPFPERVIDSVLGMQLPDGRWLDARDGPERLHVMHYLELDALYALFESLWDRAVPASLGSDPLQKAGAGAETGVAPEAREILRLMAAGLNDKAIAHELGISMRTLNRRISELMAQLNARSRFQIGWIASRLLGD